METIRTVTKNKDGVAKEEMNGRASKYNVGKDIEKRTYEGITFDSCMEMKYYRDVVLPLSRSGEIKRFELQKPFELQPKFHNGSKIVQPIVYVADFFIEYSDGRSEVIDTKGCADQIAKIKRKMFWYHYPEAKYRWITYVAKWGGWLDYDEACRLRRLAKKEKKSMDFEMSEKENDNG